MKTDILHPNAGTTVRTLTAILALAGVSLLSGCGSTIGSDTAGVGVGGTGTGSGGSTGTIMYVMAAKAASPGQVALSGAVSADGPINALVFLDTNSNYRHDPQEPSAVTGQDGAYTLQVEPADVGRYPLVALVSQSDTGCSCTLSMAKESVHAGADNLISPISSQVRALMETGSYAGPHEAAEALKVQLGLPAEADLLADYPATGNDPVAVAARQMLECGEPVR